MELYHSACEDLPEHQHTDDVDGQIMQDTEDPQAVGIPPKDIEEIFTWTPEAALSERTAHFLGPNAPAPMRHLPPGKPVTLFWQFLAWCEAMQSLGGPGGPEVRSLSTPPSWSSFWRAWTDKWRKNIEIPKDLTAQGVLSMPRFPGKGPQQKAARCYKDASCPGVARTPSCPIP